MAERPTTFSGKDAKRIAQVVRRVEQQPRLDLSGKALQGVVREPIQNWVQVTSLTPTSGRLPGKWYQYDASAASWTVQALDIWVVDANAVTLTVGTRYRGYAAGDANGRLVFVVSESAASGGAGLMWSDPYTFTYTDFSTAAFTNTLAVFTLAIGQSIHGIVVDVRTAFTGGAISAYDLQVYVDGATPVGPNVDAWSGTGTSYAAHTPTFDTGATRAVTVQASSSTQQLLAATAGVADLYFLTSTLP